MSHEAIVIHASDSESDYDEFRTNFNPHLRRPTTVPASKIDHSLYDPNASLHDVSLEEEDNKDTVLNKMTTIGAFEKSKKRTSEADESASKRRRPEIPGTSSSEFLDCQVARPGTITKLHVQNFMCHDSLEIMFNPRINFIIGRNGSGKSAILTAIVVGLGGKATTTNRGLSLRDFIKIGKHSACIEITLKNEGPYAYKKKEYGDQIVIIRVLHSSASSKYKIKAADGTTISSRKEELDRILSAFNIQIDNPVSVLNQDTARNFLNSSDPYDKYKLFMKATQLEQIETEYKTVNNHRISTLNILSDRRTYIKIAEEEVSKWKRKWHLHESLENHRKRKEALENEYFWALVIVEEKKLEELKAELEERRSKTPEFSAKLESLESKKNQLENRKSQISEQLTEIKENLQTVDKRLEEAKQNLKERKELYSKKLEVYRTTQNRLTRQRNDIKRLKDEIDKMEKMSDPENAARRREIQRKKNELEEQERSLAESLNAAKQQADVTMALLERFKEEEQGLRSEESYLTRQCEDLQQRVNCLRSQQSDALTVYGHWVPKLIKRMKELKAQGKFIKLPRGPIGAYVKLRDASWVPAIEIILGKMLHAYCVDNKNDQDVLNNLFDKMEVRGSRKPTIVNSKFFEKVHDVRRYAVQSEKYSSVLEMLVIEDPVIANCLIDQTKIETILLLPTSEEAYNIMAYAERVPKNCSRAVTKKGDTFYPDPSYRSYSGHYSKARYLQVSMDDAIRNAEEQLSEYQEKCKRVKQELQKMLKEYDLSKKKAEREQNLYVSLRKRQMEIKNEIEQLKNDEEPEPASVSSLQEELEQYNEHEQTTAEEETNLKASCEEVKRRIEEAANAYKDVQRDIQSNQEQHHKYQNELVKIKTDLQSIANQINHEKQKLENVEKGVKALEEKIAEQEKMVAEKTAEVEKLEVGRIETDRNPEIIKGEMYHITMHLRQVEAREGTMEEVARAYNTRRNKLDSMKKEIALLERGMKKLQDVIESRKKLYFTMQRLISIRVQVIFQGLLNQRSFDGEILLDHKNETLVIKVSSQSGSGRRAQDTKSLSGGERSYSTISLIMALWEAMDLPFYMLDEFDVFMDKVNRRISMDLLIDHARDGGRFGFQFVFLTPLDTGSVTSDRILTIHKLRDPRDADTEERRIEEL